MKNKNYIFACIPFNVSYIFLILNIIWNNQLIEIYFKKKLKKLINNNIIPIYLFLINLIIHYDTCCIIQS